MNEQTSSAPLDFAALKQQLDELKKDKPCPSCGHCPTCGRSANPWGFQPQWPHYRPYWDTTTVWNIGDTGIRYTQYS
jgi:hypothetical protein